MKFAHILASVAVGAMTLAACQPPASTTAEAPATETAPEAVAASEPVALPCGIIAQRDWVAELAPGATPTLTVSGKIDLGTPGYGVSLARDASEGSGATTAVLALQLRAPTTDQPQVVTEHPAYYFGPAGGAYTSVQVNCDGAPLTTIAIAP